VSVRIQKAAAIRVGRTVFAYEPLTGPQLLARVRDCLAKTAAFEPAAGCRRGGDIIAAARRHTARDYHRPLSALGLT
jgi:hypothetical protein